MIKDGYKYGISFLPKDCMAYRDGYRYGAYVVNVTNRDDMHITEWFKTKDEITKFVEEHKEYGRGDLNE